MTQSEEDDIKRVRDMVDGLMEFFDSVQIFITRHDHDEKNGEGNTFHMAFGKGNYFTRLGQVRDFVDRKEVFMQDLSDEDND